MSVCGWSGFKTDFMHKVNDLSHSHSCIQWPTRKLLHETWSSAYVFWRSYEGFNILLHRWSGFKGWAPCFSQISGSSESICQVVGVGSSPWATGIHIRLRKKLISSGANRVSATFQLRFSYISATFQLRWGFFLNFCPKISAFLKVKLLVKFVCVCVSAAFQLAKTGCSPSGVKLPRVTFHLLFLTNNDLWMFCVCVVLFLFNFFWIFSIIFLK